MFIIHYYIAPSHTKYRVTCHSNAPLKYIVVARIPHIVPGLCNITIVEMSTGHHTFNLRECTVHVIPHIIALLIKS